MPKGKVVAGVSDHAGWAVVVCVTDGQVVDRRRIELVGPGVPRMPHHHDAQGLPVDEGVALVERVRAAAEICVRQALEELPAEVGAVAIRKRPVLPPTIAERIADYRAQNVADWVMYRDVIAEAAEARGWAVFEYDAKTVIAEAAVVLGVEDLSERFREVREKLGPPWQKDHKVAMAAAIVVRQFVAGSNSTETIPILD